MDPAIHSAAQSLALGASGLSGWVGGAPLSGVLLSEVAVSRVAVSAVAFSPVPALSGALPSDEPVNSRKRSPRMGISSSVSITLPAGCSAAGAAAAGNAREAPARQPAKQRLSSRFHTRFIVIPPVFWGGAPHPGVAAKAGKAKSRGGRPGFLWRRGRT